MPHVFQDRDAPRELMGVGRVTGARGSAPKGMEVEGGAWRNNDVLNSIEEKEL